jgi:CDP-diacylglycerol--serine O-phosphatidyltransferase
MSNRVRERWELARGKLRIRTVRGGKWWRERGKKGLSAIPHLFTLLNLAFGVTALLLIIRGEYHYAALMVVGSLVADGLDGRLARWFKADGEFGKELDSLADVISFGATPAILLHEMVLHELGYYGLAATLLFPMCGALRLARFNIIKTSGFFLGVPITAAGTLLSCVAYYTVQETTEPFSPLAYAVIVLTLAYLMISSIPYPDFKKRRQNGRGLTIGPITGPILAALGLAYITKYNPWALVILPLAVYASLGPWLLVLRQWTERIRPWFLGSNG